MYLSSCNSTQSTNETTNETTKDIKAKISPVTLPALIQGQIDSIIDARDGQVYKTVAIGKQIWMAENLRYNALNSKLHPNHPSALYGRLYNGFTAQMACPNGWHLPSDKEWSEMEIFLGMPVEDANNTFWRGEHGAKLKSTTGWIDGNNGTNSSGFNGYPAGYYFLDNSSGEVDMNGVGGSGGYWSAAKGNKTWVRFLAAPKEGVNRFEDDIDVLNWMVACRCVKN